jgi:hypothetical protein
MTPVLPLPELTGTCQATSFADGSACGGPAAQLMTTGCEHEHVSADELCQDCADYFARGRLTCLQCGAHRELIAMVPVESVMPG